MSRIFALTCSLLLLGIIVSAGSAWAGDSYLAARVGAFSPQGDASHFDVGTSTELAYGFSIIPLLKCEVAGGYQRATSGDDTLEVYPLTVSGRAYLPVPLFSPYVTAGAGAYHTSLELAGRGSDSDTTFGYFAGGGVEVGLPLVLLTVEGKYQWLRPHLYGRDVDMNGVVVSAGVGVKF